MKIHDIHQLDVMEEFRQLGRPSYQSVVKVGYPKIRSAMPEFDDEEPISLR